MKLKKALIYLGSFVVLSVMFSVCYYMSYLHALNNFNQRAIERKEQLLALTQMAEPTPIPDENDSQTESVNEKNELIVLPTTKYILEIFNMKSNTTETQELNPPAYLVGLTREQIDEYLATYMSDLPLSEYNKGLISFELERFSDKEIAIKKTYNEDFVPFRFYVVVKDGYVVVFNSDLKSVYSYTHILASGLPEEDRIALSQGIYVNSLEELYSLLESYSS
ncbi:MAG: putative rane protein [Firmicutes bacterium]|nr:putative rane protein [Bacillota bacterium]